MSVQMQLPADSPIMKAWDAFKATEDFANALKWAAYPEQAQGSLWAAYAQGFRDALTSPAVAAPSPSAVAPRAWVRGGYLYTEAPDGGFHARGDDVYVFVAGGEPICLIHHPYKAPDAIFRELTEDERRAWAAKPISPYEALNTGDWNPLPEWGR